jgi:hypothetical protein
MAYSRCAPIREFTTYIYYKRPPWAKLTGRESAGSDIDEDALMKGEKFVDIDGGDVAFEIVPQERSSDVQMVDDSAGQQAVAKRDTANRESLLAKRYNPKMVI